MNKKFTIIGLVGAGMCAVLTSAVLYPDGINNYTGSPANNGLTCTKCHSASGTGKGSIEITASPAFENNKYNPNTEYTINVIVKQTGTKLFGVDAEVLTSANAAAGTITITNNNETKLVNKNVTHVKNGGAGTDSKTFSFKWKAPANGDVTVYAAGLAANGDGGKNGDQTYNTKLALTANTASINGVNASAKADINVYPNPITDKFTIDFNLDKTAMVNCNVYTITGALVANLYSQSVNAGTKKLNLNMPSDVKKGVYFIELRADDAKFSKLVVVK